MGTRADYYIGRGAEAKWLGSTAYDGYPGGIPAALLDSVTEENFVAALSAFAHGREDWTDPEQGWPWPWPDSRTTDYAYALDEGRVWICCFGSGWITVAAEKQHQIKYEAYGDEYEAWQKDGEPDGCEPQEPADLWDEEKSAVFPDMADVQNVTLGARSGVMLLR